MSKKLTKAERKELREKKRQERREKGIGFVTEFKKFILRGNVIDMSVGVIVGSSFSKITSTLTNRIFMPWITYLLGDVSKDTLLKKLNNIKDKFSELDEDSITFSEDVEAFLRNAQWD